MHHLLELINQYIIRRYSKEKDSTVNKAEYRSTILTLKQTAWTQNRIFLTSSIDNKFVFLMGDFNARVCNKDDFVDADDFLTHHLSLDDTMDGSLNISSKLEKTNLSKHRVF